MIGSDHCKTELPAPDASKRSVAVDRDVEMQATKRLEKTGAREDRAYQAEQQCRANHSAGGVTEADR